MIRSPIKWVGGKYKLRKKIISLLPPHQRYVEVFAGAAWVLFGKEPSEHEVLNDIHPEVIHFFKIVKEQPEELISSFKWDLASRDEFARLLDLDPAILDPIVRAHRFYYLVMAGWGGELHRARFQTSISDGGHGNRLIGALKHLEERILLANRRLESVIIEQQDWRVCMDRYDDEQTVMYLDPPYPNNNCNYEYNMRSMHIHKEIAERMGHARAKILLTTYNRPELRDLFSDFKRFYEVFAAGMPGKGGRKNKEMIVTNYDPEETGSQRQCDTAVAIKIEVKELLKEKQKERQDGPKIEGFTGAVEKPIASMVRSIIPPHECYVEILTGSRMVLPRKAPSRVEVLNDLDGDVMNLFRVVKNHQEEFLASFDSDPTKREKFAKLRETAPEVFGAVAHAHDFYLRGWEDQLCNPSIESLKSIYARLQTVIVEQLSWEDCVDRYDDERAVICIYMNSSNAAEEDNQEFKAQELGFYKEFAQRMKSVRVRFILVACERPELHRIFVNFHITQVQGIGDEAGEDRCQNHRIIVTNCDLTTYKHDAHLQNLCD